MKVTIFYIYKKENNMHASISITLINPVLIKYWSGIFINSASVH